MGSQQRLVFQPEEDQDPPMYPSWVGYFSARNGLQKDSSCPGDKTWSHCAWVTELSPIFRVPSSILCGFLICQSSVNEFPLCQVSCLCGFPHYDLDHFVPIIPPPSLQLDSRSSAQCFVQQLLLTHSFSVCFYSLNGFSCYTLSVFPSSFPSSPSLPSPPSSFFCFDIFPSCPWQRLTYCSAFSSLCSPEGCSILHSPQRLTS